MNRLLMKDLLAWKHKKNRLPLILKGARQVGKTWLLHEFGRTAFDDVLSVDLEKTPGLKDVFDGDISPKRILDLLGALHGKRIEPQKTLLILDEIQEVPRALTALKYFAEAAPEYAVCCAGSLLGIALHENTSFPVGKVDFLSLQPLDFEEFLLANGEEALVEFVRESGICEIPQVIVEKLRDYLKLHLVIGGMPAAVHTWIEARDFSAVEKRQRDILETYEHDFSKHAPQRIVPRLRQLWNSIPSQLSKENKKFVYGLLREGARARDYEEAMLWLLDSGLLRKVGRITKAALPLQAYEDPRAFKLYHLDVGLLRAMSELPPSAIVDGMKIFEEFKGALAEQFVLSELAGKKAVRSIRYWASDATAELDFVFAFGNAIYPLEVKSGRNPRSKSLQVYRERYKPRLSIRASLSDLRAGDGLLDIPLFALFNLENYLRIATPE